MFRQQLAQQRLQSVYSSAPNSLWNSSNVFDSAQATPSTSYWSSVSPPVSNAHEIRPPPGFGGHPTARDQRTLLAQQQLTFRQYQQQQVITGFVVFIQFG